MSDLEGGSAPVFEPAAALAEPGAEPGFDPAGPVARVATPGGGLREARHPRLRRWSAALGAAVAVLAAGELTAALAARWRGQLSVLAVAAALLAGAGARRTRVGPAATAIGLLGGAFCLAAADRPVDIAATSIVAAALYLAFQVADDGLSSFRTPSAAALVALAASAGPLVLVLADGVGRVPAHLYLPAMGVGVATAIAPVVLAARRQRAAPLP